MPSTIRMLKLSIAFIIIFPGAVLSEDKAESSNDSVSVVGSNVDIDNSRTVVNLVPTTQSGPSFSYAGNVKQEGKSFKSFSYYEKQYESGNYQEATAGFNFYYNEKKLFDAALYLGYIFHHGLGTFPDIPKALEYYEYAAINGSGKAYGNIASIYLQGTNVERDIPKALKYLNAGHKKGSYFSSYRLGYMYENGTGVERNVNLAILWYERHIKRVQGSHFTRNVSMAFNSIRRLKIELSSAAAIQ